MYKFTRIENFEISQHTCFICGKKADTVEHLFPKWLQHKFNLWDQKIKIPNGTFVSYKKLVVPACKKCNVEVFSELEKKISSNSETDADIWRWANKIHFGLTLKDKFYDWDRKNPGYKIGDVINPKDPLEQSRHFLHCASGAFKTEPDPFGSVFKFKFTTEQNFNFIHLISTNSICISLGNRGYIVFINDGQFLKNSTKKDYQEILKNEPLEMIHMLFHYARSVEFLERISLSFPIMITKGNIVKLGTAKIKKEEPINKELLSELCQQMGFTWIEKIDTDLNV